MLKVATDIQKAVAILPNQRRTSTLQWVDKSKEHKRLLDGEMRLTDAFVKSDVAPEIYRTKAVELREQRAHSMLETT